MKKSFAALLILITAVFLMSCGSNGYYDQGYEDGYKNGLEDGYLEGYLQSESESHGAQYEDGYEAGYDDGFDEGEEYGQDELLNEIRAAYEHASSKTGWYVYESWNDIMIYHDGVDPDGFELPTEEEYRRSVETLVHFCAYLDSKGFDN